MQSSLLFQYHETKSFEQCHNEVSGTTYSFGKPSNKTNTVGNYSSWDSSRDLWQEYCVIQECPEKVGRT